MTVFPDSDRPEMFYDSIRAQDPRLAAIEAKAIKKVGELIGNTAIDVGSFGLLLNLPESDLDLAVGVPPSDAPRALAILRAAMQFKGERKTSAATTRHIFAFAVDDVEIDLGVLPETDLRILEQGLNRCRAGMTRAERIEHVWKKWQLKKANRRAEYARLKLEPYRQFCPSFLWTPIL